MSDKYELVKRYYDNNLWDERRVRLAVEKNWITQNEYDEIINQEVQYEDK